VENYDFELGRVKREIIRRKAKRVLVQLPNGFKKFSKWIIEELEGVAEMFISASHTWGPCDVDFKGAKTIGADLILHFGHHPRTGYGKKYGVDVIFIPVFYLGKVYRGVKEVIELLEGYQRVGLVASVQHVKALDELKNSLEEAGIEAQIGIPREPTMFKGQVLGCDYSAALSLADKVSAYVCVAGGLFHSLGLALTVNKKVIALDPYRDRAKDITIEREKFIRKRMYKLMEAMEARYFAIVVSTKVGQYDLYSALRIRSALKEKGLRSEIILTDEVDAEKLMDLMWPDAIIITACPRISIDHMDNYPIPLINKGEVKYLLKGDLSSYDPVDALK